MVEKFILDIRDCIVIIMNISPLKDSCFSYNLNWFRLFFNDFDLCW